MKNNRPLISYAVAFNAEGPLQYGITNCSSLKEANALAARYPNDRPQVQATINLPAIVVDGVPVFGFYS